MPERPKRADDETRAHDTIPLLKGLGCVSGPADFFRDRAQEKRHEQSWSGRRREYHGIGKREMKIANDAKGHERDDWGQEERGQRRTDAADPADVTDADPESECRAIPLLLRGQDRRRRSRYDDHGNGRRPAVERKPLNRPATAPVEGNG